MSRPKAIPATPERVDEAALVTDLLAARREELDQVNHQLNLVRASIRSERHQWELAQGEGRRQLELRRQAQDDQHAAALQEIERLRRTTELANEEAVSLREHARQQCVELAEKAAQAADLAQQRLDIAKLRLEATDRLQRAQDVERTAATTSNEASHKFEEAQQALAACTAKETELHATYNHCKIWQEDLTRREQDCQVVQALIDAKLKEARDVSVGAIG